MKKILVLSYGPPPSTHNKVVDGTALRYWRIARELSKEEKFDVTLSIASKEPDKAYDDNFNVVKLNTDTKNFKETIQGFDVIVFSYAFGDLSLKVIENANSSTVLIADTYSPYYVEGILGINTQENIGHYLDQVNRCNKVIDAADYILYAGDAQKNLLEGVAGSLGILYELNRERTLELPAFPETPRKSPIVTRKSGSKLSILWFGGMYEWFDANKIIDIFSNPFVSENAILTVVGGYNPSYDKNDRVHNKQYQDFIIKAENKGLLGSVVFIREWVDYQARIQLFKEMDVAISLNKESRENSYSFRIRVADLLGNGVPVITNGGDQLGEYLINNNYGYRLDINDDANTVSQFIDIISDRKNLLNTKKLLNKTDVIKKHRFETYSHDLINLIKSSTKKEQINFGFADKKNIYHIKKLEAEVRLKDRNINSLKSTNSELEVNYKNYKDKYRKLEEINKTQSAILRNPFRYIAESVKYIIRRKKGTH